MRVFVDVRGVVDVDLVNILEAEVVDDVAVRVAVADRVADADDVVREVVADLLVVRDELVRWREGRKERQIIGRWERWGS